LVELRVASDEVEVVVLPEVGARLHRVRAFGHDLLHAPADPADHRRDPFSGGGFVMAPWCNRIDAGPVEVGGRRIDLASNFPDGTVIHGQVYDRPWTLGADNVLRVQGGGAGSGGWPWDYEVTLRVTVDGTAIHVDQGLTNLSDPADETGTMPAGLGIHPWFVRPVEVAVPAKSVFTDNTATSPRPEPVTGPYDLRTLGEMPTGLDATWTDLDQPVVQMRWPAAGVGATLRIAPGAYVVAANPPDREVLALEPQTHAPQGLRRLLHDEPGALTLLAPGATLALRTTLDLHPS
jgi:aldose 1-epimerase